MEIHSEKRASSRTPSAADGRNTDANRGIRSFGANKTKGYVTDPPRSKSWVGVIVQRQWAVSPLLQISPWRV